VYAPDQDRDEVDAERIGRPGGVAIRDYDDHLWPGASSNGGLDPDPHVGPSTTLESDVADRPNAGPPSRCYVAARGPDLSADRSCAADDFSYGLCKV